MARLKNYVVSKENQFNIFALLRALAHSRLHFRKPIFDFSFGTLLREMKTLKRTKRLKINF